MPSLSQHQSGEFTKLLLIGDSKSGKTGSLAPLAFKYKLRILDFDNGLDALVQVIKMKEPKALDNVEFRTLRYRLKSSPTGTVVDGMATAFIDALKMLDNWKYGNIDLGPPSA